MQYIVSIVLLMMLTLTTLKAETTSNLVSQDFTTGWSGTNINRFADDVNPYNFFSRRKDDK